MLKTGDNAPLFELKDKDGKLVKLADFRGKKVVLYFYSRDNTSGCSRQAVAFKEVYEQFKGKGIEIIGISKDTEKSHQKFAEKYELPFVLLSDPEFIALKAYEVWVEKKVKDKVSMKTLRTTFVIDENGVIEKVFEKVKPDKNAAQVLEYLS